MSVQAVIVSFIITTCSVAPFRFHHLCSFKQPAAGSRVDFPGAKTVRLWVAGCNCCLCTNIAFVLPQSKISRASHQRGMKTKLITLGFCQARLVLKCWLLTFLLKTLRCMISDVQGWSNAGLRMNVSYEPKVSNSNPHVIVNFLMVLLSFCPSLHMQYGNDNTTGLPCRAVVRMIVQNISVLLFNKSSQCDLQSDMTLL